MSKYWQVLVERSGDYATNDTWIIKSDQYWSRGEGCLTVYEACYEYIDEDDKHAWQVTHVYAPGTWDAAEIQPYEEDEDE